LAKTTDINREHALFELLDGDEPLLDAEFSENGVLYVVYNRRISGRVFEWEQIHKLLDEGRDLADQDC
jgi:hypothetical protein